MDGPRAGNPRVARPGAVAGLVHHQPEAQALCTTHVHSQRGYLVSRNFHARPARGGGTENAAVAIGRPRPLPGAGARVSADSAVTAGRGRLGVL